MRKSYRLFALLAGMWVSHAAPADIFDYVAAADPSYAWEKGETGPGYTNLKLTSLTWQNHTWTHTVTVFRPAQVAYPDTCVLLINGGGFTQRQELMLGQLLANATGTTLALLWDIPNQPLWGMREDDLIAHTFVKAMETGDHSWPLLFPMAKAAVRAMDALSEYSQSAYGTPFTRFIATGASKRGWTTWFTGALDPRVVAIMPLVYDNLNLNAQMTHQMDTWGHYSPQIDDYTRRGLQQQLATETGQQLSAMVDPYTYRDRITCPKYLVNGTNDAYWTLDALNLYRDDLSGPTFQLYVPNSGHGLNDITRVLNGAGGFVRLIASGSPLPELSWSHEVSDRVVAMRVIAPTAGAARLWYAQAEKAEFGQATWQSIDLTVGDGEWTGEVARPATGSIAVFAEVEVPVTGGARMPLSTTLQIVSPN